MLRTLTRSRSSRAMGAGGVIKILLGGLFILLALNGVLQSVIGPRRGSRYSQAYNSGRVVGRLFGICLFGGGGIMLINSALSSSSQPRERQPRRERRSNRGREARRRSRSRRD